MALLLMLQLSVHALTAMAQKTYGACFAAQCRNSGLVNRLSTQTMTCCPLWESHVVSVEAVSSCTQNTLKASELTGQHLPNKCLASTPTSEHTSREGKVTC